MKLRFDAHQQFQIDAVAAVVDLFEGQGKGGADSVRDPRALLGIYPNALSLDWDTVVRNAAAVQLRNRIAAAATPAGTDFSVEMETGTGKTYVYLRTILELHRKYGFGKFIILVPSVAIREGVIKALQITRSHFRELYDNIPYRYYEYVSRNLSQVKAFAQSSNLEIMIMTMGAFNKDANILYSSRDQMQGEQPITYIQQTRPILILDEPQNMEGEATAEKLKMFNALFRLRYSATHKNLYNLVYRLSPADAYQQGLVKKIEVFSVVDSDDGVPSAAIKLIDVSSVRTKVKAKVEVQVKDAAGRFTKTTVAIVQNDDLRQKTGNGIYDGYIVDELTAHAPDFGYTGTVRFKNGVELKLGESLGKDTQDIMRAQIRSTIERHIEKRRELKKKGIKTLSLFFIDKVDHFVKEDGFIRATFDAVFTELKTQDPDLAAIEPASARKGYFAEKNGEFQEREKSIAENKEAYDLIMKDKERLLSFDEPTEFIFTHSALKEGWDNPNVFNICTLNTTVSTMKKRQEIGRGMRLCVNQDGERVFDRNINLLSVIANEHYAAYVSGLQDEFVADGILNPPPAPFNARGKQKVRLRPGFERDPQFSALWGKIARKTHYEVAVNTERLVAGCIVKLNQLSIPRRQVVVTRVGVEFKENEVGGRVLQSSALDVAGGWGAMSLVDYVKDETRLTRQSVTRILAGVKPQTILNNPERFAFEAIRSINESLLNDYVEQISYRISGDAFSAEQFEGMLGHKDSVQEIRNKDKSIYDAVVFESSIEKDFTLSLDSDERIKLFIKLPGWFSVKTPLGGYTPDWAIVTARPGAHDTASEEKVYFVIETKSTTDASLRRVSENRKVACAKKHFEVIEVTYKDVESYAQFEELMRQS